MSAADTYEVYAVKYGEMTNRTRHTNMILADHHDAPMPIDYFVWVITNAERTIVVDTGFDKAEGERRGRVALRTPREGLAMLGINADTVQDVIITHMHYDHAGTLDDFPAARFHVNDLELQFSTSRHMCHDFMRHAYAVEDVVGMVRRLFEGRVAFCQGEQALAPGITLHHVGGHTMGMQSVRVKTRRGWVVLASDACHFYENMSSGLPFPAVYDVGAMLEGFNTLRRLAPSPAHIVPGHDPLVLKQYPAPKPDLEGIAVRLDVAPTE